jgi:hypothetical protein
MSNDDKAIDLMENQIPYLSGLATQAAYNKAIALGLTVLVSEDNAIYAVSNEKRTKIKDIEPAVPMNVGQTFNIQ